MAGEVVRFGFEYAGAGIACLLPGGEVVAANRALCDLLGYASDELQQVGLDAVLEAESLLLLRERMQAAPALDGGPEVLCLDCRCKSGETIPVTIVVSPVATGAPEEERVEAYVATFLPREQPHEDNDGAMFRHLVESATDYGILRLDREGRVQSWSTGAERIFGYQRDEILGQSIARVFTPEQRERRVPEQERAQALTEGKAQDDRWHLRQDGARFWASGVMSPFYATDGELHGFVKIVRDLTEQKLADERYRHLSEHDPLTGLANRARFNSELAATLGTCTGAHCSGAVIFIDLDNFKSINDTFGHHHGDLLLQQVAERLARCVRSSDLVARLSGDEFGIIYTGLRGLEEAERLAAQLVTQMGRPFQLEQHRVVCGGSVGVALFPRDGQAPQPLLKCADLAMYRAKAQGRNTWKVYDQAMDAEVSERRALGKALGAALDRHELTLHYQPQFTTDGKLRGVEALLRPTTAPLSALPTGDCVCLAEELGLIVPIGEWVIRTACQDSSVWRNGDTGPVLSINLSSRQLRQPRFLEIVRAALEATGLPPRLLELEITEKTLTENDKVHISVLASLQSLGVRISIDDFGTGSSSLGDLKHLPVDAIKIDQTFVRGLPDDGHDAAIASAVIGMARSLGLEVIAEGVENGDQLECLKRLGCNRVQGFLLSKPLPAEEIGRAVGSGQWVVN